MPDCYWYNNKLLLLFSSFRSSSVYPSLLKIRSKFSDFEQSCVFKDIKCDIPMCHEGHEDISAYLHFSAFFCIFLHFSHTFLTHGKFPSGISYLISLNPLHLENTAHVGSYRNLKNLVEISKITHFFGKTFPNLWTHSPTPGFLWDLGTQKVKFRFKKKARLGGLGFSHPTHPILGKFPPKKNTLIFGPSITKGKGWDGVTRYTPTWQQLKLALLVISEPL